MPRVPRISGREAINAFKKAGFVLDRTKGSHSILKKDGIRYQLSIPVHGSKTVATPLLASQIKTAGLTVDQFCEYLRSS